MNWALSFLATVIPATLWGLLGLLLRELFPAISEILFAILCVFAIVSIYLIFRVCPLEEVKEKPQRKDPPQNL